MKIFSKITAIVLTSIGIAILASFCIPFSKTQDESRLFFKVKRGDMRVVIKKKGVVKSIQPCKIRHGLPLTLKITYIVPDATHVEKGQTILQFDDQEIVKAITQKTEELAQQKLKIGIQETTGKLDAENEDLQAVSARLQYKEARYELRRHKNCETLETRKKQIDMEQAEVEQKKIAQKLDRLPQLLQEGLATRDEFSMTKIMDQSAKNTSNQTRMNLEYYKSYDSPFQLQQQQNKLTMAKSELDSLAKRHRIQRQQRQAQLEIEKIKMIEMEKELEVLKQRREDTVIHAPDAGIALHGDIDSSDQNLKLERKIDGNEVVLTLPNLRQVLVITKVTEDQVYLVHPEMSAFIKASAAESIGGKVLRVAEVPALGSDYDMHGDKKEFEVNISAMKEGVTLPLRTPIDIEIEIALLKNILFIPRHALEKSMGKTYCYVRKDGLARTPVDIGTTGDVFVEIRSGLKEGDLVFIGSRLEYTD